MFFNVFRWMYAAKPLSQGKTSHTGRSSSLPAFRRYPTFIFPRRIGWEIGIRKPIENVCGCIVCVRKTAVEVKRLFFCSEEKLKRYVGNITTCKKTKYNRYVPTWVFIRKNRFSENTIFCVFYRFQVDVRGEAALPGKNAAYGTTLLAAGLRTIAGFYFSASYW